MRLKLEHIGVIAARQTAVARDNDEQALLHRAHLGVDGIAVARFQSNARHGVIHGLKVGTRLDDALLGMAQLGGCDQLHGLGDLHGGLDALHAALNVLHIAGSHNSSSLLPKIMVRKLVFREELGLKVHDCLRQFVLYVVDDLGIADGLCNIRVVCVQIVEQFVLEIADESDRNINQVLVYHGKDDDNLLFNRNRAVLRLLEHFYDACALIQTRLGVCVEVGAELRECLTRDTASTPA